MTRALTLASRGWGRVHPNPMVGAVVVRDGEVVGEGWHREFGDVHAERMALEAAGEAACGATLVVTLEPCRHHGKQPPCVDAILASGVARVVYALADPNPEAGGGAEVLRARGVDVEQGVGAQSSAALNARFVHQFTHPDRPWVVVKMAVSMDGCIADTHGGSRWLSGTDAREWVHALRANVDAIAVGARTVLSDAPQLTVRGAVTPRTSPVRIVFDRSARLDASVPLLGDAGPPVFVVVAPDAALDRQHAIAATGATVVPAGSIAEALRMLHAQGVGSVLVEGGGRLAGAMLRDDVIDRICQIQSPLWLGDGMPAWSGVPSVPIASAARWRVIERRALGDDTLIVMER